MSTVCVLGTGAMGSAVARKLLADGLSVTVWNRNPDRARPLAEEGAHLAASLDEAVARAELLIVVLASASTTAEVVDRIGSLDGRILVNFATGTPNQARALGEKVRAAGGVFLSGELSGRPTSIGTAAMHARVSGEEVAWLRLRPVVERLATTRYAGADVALAPAFAMALTGGFMLSAIASFLEVTAFAQTYGIDAAELIADARHYADRVGTEVEGMLERISAGDFADPPASVRVYVQALDAATSAMQDAGIPGRIAQAAADNLRRAIDAGHADDSPARSVELLREGP